MSRQQSEQRNRTLLALDNVQFSTERRHVTRLDGSDVTEVYVVGWEPGRESSLHSHDESKSIVTVLAGTVTISDGDATPEELPVGGILITPAGCMHKVANHSGRRAVTLHVYTPPLNVPMPQPFVDLSDNE